MRGYPLGNPYSWRPSKHKIIRVKNRDEAISKYSEYLHSKIESDDEVILKEFNKLLAIYNKHGSVNLVCCCFPDRCHGEVIIDILKNLLEDNHD